jgi:hypothetical protein
MMGENWRSRAGAHAPEEKWTLTKSGARDSVADQQNGQKLIECEEKARQLQRHMTDSLLFSRPASQIM